MYNFSLDAIFCCYVQMLFSLRFDIIEAYTAFIASNTGIGHALPVIWYTIWKSTLSPSEIRGLFSVVSFTLHYEVSYPHPARCKSYNRSHKRKDVYRSRIPHYYDRIDKYDGNQIFAVRTLAINFLCTV